MKVTEGVRREALVAGATPDALRVDRFFYPAGGHTHWHAHDGEQVLYGESGRGCVRFAEQGRTPLAPGDVVYIPVGARHWHGAAPGEPLVHLAVTAGGGTTWMEPVSPEEYADGCGTG